MPDAAAIATPAPITTMPRSDFTLLRRGLGRGAGVSFAVINGNLTLARKVARWDQPLEVRPPALYSTGCCRPETEDGRFQFAGSRFIHGSVCDDDVSTTRT